MAEASPEVEGSASREGSAKPFRFKRKRPVHAHDINDDDDLSRHKSYRRRHHHEHSRSHRRSRHYRSENPTSSIPATSPPPGWDETVDPDTAFRESLFDALADDEGADYWQGVYGQPIHTYSPYYQSKAEDDRLDENGDPHLERMTDDEYVRYVREKMWEKSHGYIMEERRRRERDKEQKKKQAAEGRHFQVQVEEALKKGEERRRNSRWKDSWRRYRQYWGSVDKKGQMVWPVASGEMRDVSKEQVEAFYKHAPTSGEDAGFRMEDVLKKERVKWHPDKMQQRAGAERLDKETVELVTAVFQTIDSMWNAINR